MAAPPEIVELVERFERRIEELKSADFNELELRDQFLNPFFSALGWDVHNRKDLSSDQREVKLEEAIRVEESIRNPDYTFRLGKARKFFVEAKKPAVNIEGGVYPAFQVRRYAWSSGLPISILTDFEEFSVYDCRSEPHKSDKPARARLLYLQYDQYVERWDEIASLFSRESVLAGSLDKYIEAVPEKRGAKRVDAALLDEISGWREALAQNMARRNPALPQPELNFAVQRTIDRILFLRICEDRSIEEYGRLRALLEGQGVYQRLQQLFVEADDRYNSGIFRFREERGLTEPPDRITPALAVDDAVLKDMIKDLYFPDSPYVFSEIPAEILGQVYEQFLGKVIVLEEGKGENEGKSESESESAVVSRSAKVEYKPEVRKAGGVYYTPSYIVEYIVKNTVGKLLEEKTPQEAAGLRILDPACGSGSFLIGAYQYLLDWHLEWYLQNLVPLRERGYAATSPEVLKLLPEAPERREDRRARKIHARAAEAALPVFQAGEGEWRLTTAERKRILLNNIYGVDIDPQAVEVTKLSLLLKVLEGETEETISSLLRYARERALPDLGSNIKCGNSLIGWDILDDRPDLSKEELARINPFDWEKEFPEVFSRGGFDAVIGNPPYVRMEEFKEIKCYLRSNYASHEERSDFYTYFIERGQQLINRDGKFGFIVSNKFLRAKYGKNLRYLLLKRARIDQVIDFAGLPVFRGATVRTIILLGSPLKEDGNYNILYSQPLPLSKFQLLSSGVLSIEDAIKQSISEVPSSYLVQSYWSFNCIESEKLLRKLREANEPLVVYCNGKIFMGIKSGLSNAFIIDAKKRNEILSANPEAKKIIKPFLNGREVRRYHIQSKNLYLIYTYHGVPIEKYPRVEEHLSQFRKKLINRATKQQWYELQQPQFKFSKFLDQPKIIFPDISKSPRFTYDDSGYYGANTTYFIPVHDFYLLGVLNSSIASFYFRNVCAGLEGSSEIYLRFFGQYLEGFPIRTIDFSNPEDVARHDRMVSLVQTMLDLHKQLAEVRGEHERTLLQRRIEATDRQIDALVYELYGLTEEEIRIVEEASV
ncbi:MAG: N-6 DNA methylase [Methanotrichaceae archaeon]|nr:N-6 DNA methylase [Methanotrichaceae archaeon]